MKYFVKFLPDVNGRFVNLDNPEVKLKPFLCSKDFKIGDTITWTDGRMTDDPGIITDEQDIGIVETNPDAAFKVMGQISPGAIPFIKDGMEFENLEECWISNSEIDQLNTYKIKGPCGHFH